jgi:two-component system, NtrC family, nitrogen regulation sensor histidine kinase GlnL
LAAEEPAALLDELVTGVLLLNADLTVRYLNTAAEALFAVSAHSARGRPFRELAAGAENLLPLFDRVLAGVDTVAEREVALPGPGGTERVFDCTAARTGSAGLLAEIKDVTQHRRLSRENALLAQLGASRLMVRQLAHEIKNPLGGLRGAAQLLQRELTDPELHEYTRVIINEADRLTSLLDSMLGPGRAPSMRRVSVHELLERVYQLLRSEAPVRVQIERDYDPSLPPITADPDLIIQAMLNLGRNSLQALAGVTADPPRLIVRTRAALQRSLAVTRARPAALIQFEDNGPGVPADIRDTLFYPLVSGRALGTGLGLGIAQDLVSRHAGLIEFDSAPGRTVFTISLPMEAA